MKTFYRCVSCYQYSFDSANCKECGNAMVRPYPARFSIVKEDKHRALRKSYQSKLEIE